jgi:plastocyanin
MNAHRIHIASGVAIAAAAVALVASAFAGPTPAGASSASANSHAITLKNIAFHPAKLRVAVGQTVTWKWEDAALDTQHNVTSTGAARFKSSPTKMTGTYTVRFTHIGTYRFECTIHPQSMQGEIIVH